MYEYNSDKILQRQKVCLKCRSFVTHEKSGDTGLICPLCGNQIKSPTAKFKKITPDQMKLIVADFYERMKARKAESKK